MFLAFVSEYLYSILIITISVVLFIYLYYLYSHKERGDIIENRKNIIFSDQPLDDRDESALK